MAFRQIPVSLDGTSPNMGSIEEIVVPIMRDVMEAVQNHAKEHLSGVPYEHEGKTHVINKRSGIGAASVQVQYPFGSPFKGKIFAFASTKYSNNPEVYNYLAILEGGRGEIKPRYTPSMLNGKPQNARLTLPGGPHHLVNGMGGFRGMTGNYAFVQSIPPMEGKGWLEAAVEEATAEIPEIIEAHLGQVNQ